jgi:hypothetical protein
MVTEVKVLCEERRKEMGERKARRYLFGLCCVFILDQGGGGGGVEGMILQEVRDGGKICGWVGGWETGGVMRSRKAPPFLYD